MDFSTFKAHIEAVRAYSRTGNQEKYPLPLEIFDQAIAEQLPKAAERATVNYEDSLMTFANGQETILTTETDSLVNGEISLEEFKRKLAEDRERAKMIANADIDAYFDTLLAIGQQDPKARAAILVLVAAVENFFQGVLKNLTMIVVQLVQTVINAVNKAIGFIKNSFKSLGNSIKKFFGGLFGLQAVATTLEPIDALEQVA